MKKVILSLNERIPENYIDDFVNMAIENGITDFIVDDRHIFQKLTAMDFVNLYSSNPSFNPQFLILRNPIEDIVQKELELSKNFQYLVGIHHQLATKEDETYIINLAKKYPDIAFIIVELTNAEWKILPFENLIAEFLSVDILLFSNVDSIEDSELMSKLLEVGVDGIVFTPQNAEQIKKLTHLISGAPNFKLVEAELLNIKPISKADRVCVDTTSLLHKDEGMLVGSTALGFAFIQAEVSDNAFTKSRPFRVNAGDVSAYTLVPSFDEKGDLKVKTKYLSEIKGGDDVIIVNTKGAMRIVTVGRVKIETRPMLLLNMQIPQESEIIRLNVIVQNAESVNLMKPNGSEQIPVTKIKRGDRILAYVGPSATHFGTPIKETIIEK